ncbi:MAG: bifunctional protein-serine/threonine kinase/phosphatase [Saccharospirillaceae bacterium]|nr:bifunctional protein-serine/threonine kinase/phosphatase [Saccharospirillaceae bacterium]
MAVVMGEQLQVSFGGYSTAGVKDENQDAFAAHQPGLSQAKYKGIGVCIADGVSCSDQAQLASSTAVTHFLQDYYCTPDSWDVKTSASKVLSSLNAWLYHHGQQASARHNGLVTTFSALIAKSNSAHIFHAGDSRIYRFRMAEDSHDAEFEQLTRDHCISQGNPEKGGKVYLSRALGMDNHLEVDYHCVDIHPGDCFLFSTDGVHDFFSTSEIKHWFSQLTAEDQQYQFEQACQKLVDQALQRGSDDNCSCFVLRIEQTPAPDIVEAQRQLSERIIPPVLEVGHKIDQLRVQKVLYSGTRSHVYLVENSEQRKFVLKAPSANFSDDLVYLDGFSREQWVGNRVDHGNVMKIYTVRDGSRFLYHLCEYVEGSSLRQWMHDHPRPALKEVRDLVEQVIHGLRAFQRLGMVHRDLKPENILITNDGKVKLIDFGTVAVQGLAEVTNAVEEDCPVGSVFYIAPEYVMNGVARTQSDLFSLAVIIYEMLAGTTPYEMDEIHRKTPKSISEWQYRSLAFHRSDVPAWLDLALEKACHPNIQKRHRAYSELWQDLNQPNPALVGMAAKRPLIERNPLRFWQGTSLLLLAIVIVQQLLLIA